MTNYLQNIMQISLNTGVNNRDKFNVVVHSNHVDVSYRLYDKDGVEISTEQLSISLKDWSAMQKLIPANGTRSMHIDRDNKIGYTIYSKRGAPRGMRMDGSVGMNMPTTADRSYTQVLQLIDQLQKIAQEMQETEIPE